MILIRVNGCSSVNLFPKLLKFHLKSRNYKDLLLLNCYKRCSYSSKTETVEINKRTYLRSENYFLKEHRATPFILKNRRYAKVHVSNEVIDMLCDIFETSDEKFKNALLRQHQLGMCSKSQIRNNALCLKQLKITDHHLIFAPGLLLLEKENIEAKRPLIEKPYLFENIHDGLGFAFFPEKLINMYNKKFGEEEKIFSPFRNKIYYIGNKLSVPVDFLTLQLVDSWKVLHVTKNSIDKYIDLLLGINCKPMGVIQDIEIFLHNYDITKKRLNEMSQIKCVHSRLWWCWTHENRYVRFYSRAKKYENCFLDDAVEVLKEELEINEEGSRDYISKGGLQNYSSKILRYKIVKYKEAGFSKDEILSCPFVLSRSDETILNRIEMLKKKDLFNYLRFYMLGWQENKFNKYVKYLHSIKKSFEKDISLVE